MKKTKHTMLTAAILTAAASAITASARTVNASDSVEAPQMSTIIKEEPELFSAVYGPPPAVYRDGDVNGDGKVDVRDLTAVLAYRHNSETELVSTDPDINNDGQIDELDVLSLLNFLEGKTNRPRIEGDMNDDGILNQYDLSLFTTEVNNGADFKYHDINHDSVVNYKDIETFLEQYRKYGKQDEFLLECIVNSGDVNFNDQIDLTDYKLLKDRVMETNPNYDFNYDLNQDAYIDDKDLKVLFSTLIEMGYSEAEILNATEEQIQTKYGVFPVKNDFTE